MGLFDVSLQKEIHLNKEQLNALNKNLGNYATQSKVTNNRLEITDFKLNSSLLKYNLIIEATKTKLTIAGELQQVLWLTILIVLAILLTYGFGVIIIVAYAYYQKRVATKFLEEMLEKVV